MQNSLSFGAKHDRSITSRVVVVFILALLAVTLCSWQLLAASGSDTLLLLSPMVPDSSPAHVPAVSPQVAPAAQKAVAVPTPVTGPTDLLARIARVRIDQHSVSQYRSQQEHDTWWNSTCSAAALAELANYYGLKTPQGRPYRVTDVLQKELSVNTITPAQGLTRANGVELTLPLLGMNGIRLSNPSIDWIEHLANLGYPVYINFPPGSYYTGGHFMLLMGSVDDTLYTADSSLANIQTWTRSSFSSNWRGYAVVAVPNTLSILQPSSLTAPAIDKLLAQSPAKGMGQMFLDLSRQYHMNVAVVLGIYQEESQFGTSGITVVSHSVGNIRCTAGWNCVTASGAHYTCQQDPCADGYRYYNSVRDGAKDLFALLSGPVYVGRGLITPGLIFDTFAPSADQNDPTSYARHVLSWMLS